MSIKNPTRSSVSSSFILFLAVFILWQIYYLISVTNPDAPILLIDILYFAMYILGFAALIAIARIRRINLSDIGFKNPGNASQCVKLAVISIAVYIAVTLLPGFAYGFSSPPFPHTFYYFVFTVLNAIAVGLVTESIFRGYIFKNSIDRSSFFTALYVSALLFSIYQIPIITLASMNANDVAMFIFTQIVPSFAIGLFLGFFFYQTDWSLLGPVIFQIGTLLYLFYPPLMANSPWWMKLSSQVAASAILILILDEAIKQPRLKRIRYGLES